MLWLLAPWREIREEKDRIKEGQEGADNKMRENPEGSPLV